MIAPCQRLMRQVGLNSKGRPVRASVGRRVGLLRAAHGPRVWASRRCRRSGPMVPSHPGPPGTPPWPRPESMRGRTRWRRRSGRRILAGRAAQEGPPMCGRMTQVTDPAEVARIFDADARIGRREPASAPRYNVAPTQPLTVVRQRAERGPHRGAGSLGPHPVVRQVCQGGRQAHQRPRGDGGHQPVVPVELQQAPLHRAQRWLLRVAPHRRPQAALLPSSTGGRRAGHGRPVGGLEGPRDRAVGALAAVITTDANRLVGSIHDRMPVLLPREAWDDWLDPATGRP